MSKSVRRRGRLVADRIAAASAGVKTRGQSSTAAMDTNGYRRPDPLQGDHGPRHPGCGVAGVEQRHDRDACGGSFATERLAATATEHHRRLLGMPIEAADREIDALVDDL